MDEQVSGQTIVQNVFSDLGDAGLYFHCGAAHSAADNILHACAQQRNGAYLKSCNAGGNPTWCERGSLFFL